VARISNFCRQRRVRFFDLECPLHGSVSSSEIEQFDGSVITRGCEHCHREALHTAPKSTDVHILARDRKKTEDLNKLLVGSGTAASSVVHGGARARLDPAHAQRIIAITDTGDRGLIALQACQAYARGVSEVISTK
jgi:bifunctional ADP-heptose synthase (sugar kinase/adenylyltransferase)